MAGSCQMCPPARDASGRTSVGRRHGAESCGQSQSAPAWSALSRWELDLILALEEEDFFESRAANQGPLGAGSDAGREPTTLMVRNVSCKLTADKIREHLREIGFDGTYDFFYLPMYRSSGASNQGYFFLNFKAPEEATAFKQQVQGQSICGSHKLCNVTVAEWQGLAELWEHFRKKTVMKSGNRPIFL